MKRKIIGIFVCMLLIATAAPAVISTNHINIDTTLSIKGIHELEERQQTEAIQAESMLNRALLSSIFFTENKGQFPDEVVFQTQVPGATIYLCRNKVVTVLSTPSKDDKSSLINDDRTGEFCLERTRKTYDTNVIVTSFLGANPTTKLKGEGVRPHYHNYFIDNDPSRWFTEVHNYDSVYYTDLYPGIDLKYYNANSNLKYDFIVHPGADPSVIQMQYSGVEHLSILGDGDLDVMTNGVGFVEKKPVIYQEVNGIQYEVNGEFSLNDDTLLTFELNAKYDNRYALIIDPGLEYSTYLGGINWDGGHGIAVDASGCVYVTGFTESTGFPTSNAYDSSYNGAYDVFITKLSSSGDALVYSTYLGGTGHDWGWDIEVDANDCAYITGYTESSDYPTYNAYDASYSSGIDVFVTKLSSSGDALVYSTYLGGTGSSDWGWCIAVDASDCAYITGYTNSPDYPTYNAYDSSYNGGTVGEYVGDAFITKLSSTGDTLVYSTYLGGTSSDGGHSITVDASGCAYVTGYTESSDFPTSNAYDSTKNGESDVFVTKLSPSGDTLVYSTYLGGTGDTDWGWDIALDATDCAYIIGTTDSSDFPTHNAYDASYNGAVDVFVTKLSPSGDTLVYSTYLGGTDYEEGFCIAVDISGRACISGKTESLDFPTYLAYDNSYNGGFSDVFVAMFSASGNALFYSTYLGGSESDYGYDIVVDAHDCIYVNGETGSSDFPTYNAYDDTFNSLDAFIAKFNADDDADGLLNDWEINGYDADGDGTIDVDLPAMGADPLHQDLFIEVDWMEIPGPTGHSHRPAAASIQTVVTAFDNAPTTNPDGTSGIHLHVDYGPNSPLTWGPTAGGTWGALSEGNALNHVNLLGETTSNGYQWTGSTSGVTYFDDYKSTNFDDDRQIIFHYCIFCHDHNARHSSGVSRNDDTTFATFRQGASDFIVSLGNSAVNLEPGTFMHEFGHNLGLTHGGTDHINYKPNYVSIMRYGLQFPGLIVNGVDGTFDYSRFVLPSLNENALDEPAGLSGVPAAANYGTRFYSPGGIERIVNDINNPIDWNWDGDTTDTGVTVNINYDFDKSGNPILNTSMDSYNDWPNIRFNGGLVGAGAPGEALPIATEHHELTLEEAEKMAIDYSVMIKGPGVVNHLVGYSQSYAYIISNTGDLDDSYTIEIHSIKTWADTTSIPTSVSIQSKSSKTYNIPVSIPPGTPLGDEDWLNISVTSVSNPLIHASIETHTIVIDDAPPSTLKTISAPKYGVNDEFVTSQTVFNLTATDNDLSDIPKIFYRIWFNNAWEPAPGMGTGLLNNFMQYTGNFTLLGEGKHYIEYYAVDSAGIVENMHNQTHFVDDTPPELQIDEPITLWPPRHKYRRIFLSQVINDVSDLYDETVNVNDVVITNVSSDEPENGAGDGNTNDDIVIIDDRTVKLRAERNEYSNGRVYTINFKIADFLGNTAYESYQVYVRVDFFSPAVDDGAESGYLVENFPSTSLQNPLIQVILKIVERFPTAFPLLRQLLGY